jgi:hypothetical protein
VAFVNFSKAEDMMRGKRVALVGSAPSALGNSPGNIDQRHKVVVRVNNYKVGANQGYRTDIHYSFYGTSIKKTASELKRDGVKMCMCKCPNGKPIESAWHEQHRRLVGIDFRYIYDLRRNFWFCDTFVPSDEQFVSKFELLERHIPTTGFSAILDVLACKPKSLTLTGFDFFTSGMHNVDEKWKAGDSGDPIGHKPELEFAWLLSNRDKYPFIFDEKLSFMMNVYKTSRAAV